MYYLSNPTAAYELGLVDEARGRQASQSARSAQASSVTRSLAGKTDGSLAGKWMVRRLEPSLGRRDVCTYEHEAGAWHGA